MVTEERVKLTTVRDKCAARVSVYSMVKDIWKNPRDEWSEEDCVNELSILRLKIETYLKLYERTKGQ